MQFIIIFTRYAKMYKENHKYIPFIRDPKIFIDITIVKFFNDIHELHD